MPDKQLILYFNGVQLTEPCKVCDGRGESKPLPVPICPGCERKGQPLNTPDEDAGAKASLCTSNSEWLIRNPLKCPACGQHADYQDFGLEPIWCCDCEGRGWELTSAGRELRAFSLLFGKAGN